MTWQATPILFPDVETVVPAALRSSLAARGISDVFVGRKVPAERRPRMVTVIRDGGNVSAARDRARVRMLIWDEDDAKVNDLAALVVALVPLMVDGAPILRVEHLSGPYEVPDDSGQPCRYLLFQIDTRGVSHDRRKPKTVTLTHPDSNGPGRGRLPATRTIYVSQGWLSPSRREDATRSEACRRLIPSRFHPSAPGG
jgi:hypothetical protein